MKKIKDRNLKGSVLLTVVTVMALLIIFMTAAVTLSNSMNNRAHANYSDSQAEYTAKAAIQSFTQALEDNGAVAQAVLNMGVGDVETPAVIVADKGMGNVGYYDDTTGNWVKDRIKIEYVKDNISYDPAQEAWVPMQVIKITATGKVGKQEKSVSYFIERASVESKSASIKGFQTLAGGGHQNNGAITGALTMGLQDNGYLEYAFRNDYGLYVDTMFVNGHFSKDEGNHAIFNVQKPNTQYVVMGDLTLRGSKFEINVDYPYGSTNNDGTLKSENMTQQTIPYLYVKGNLGSSTGDTTLIVNAVGADNNHELKANAPFNIFCGSIGATLSDSADDGTGNLYNRLEVANASTWGGVELNGADLYLMNDITASIHESNLNPAKSSELYKWSSSVLNGTAVQNYSTGGSIYCNHTLNIGKDLHVGGNLVVQGNLNLNGKLDVDGDLVVKGRINDLTKIGTVGGKIYYDSGAAREVYIMFNKPTDGNLKPDVVKVENFETGNIYVANKVVANIPAYGDFEAVENELLEGYEPFILQNGNDTGWQWKDENGGTDIFAEIGFADASAFGAQYDKWINDASIKDNLDIENNYDGSWGKQVTIYVKKDESGKAVDYKPVPTYQDMDGNETYEPISYYYVNDGEYTPADPDDIHTELLVADKDGNPTNETTYALTTTYVVSYDGTVTDEITDEEGTWYVADEQGNATNVPATKYSYFYKVDPESGETTGELADGIYSYYRKKPGDVYEEISEEEAYGPNPGMYKAWYDDSFVTEEFFIYKNDPTGNTGKTWHDANLATEDDLVSGGYNLVSSYPGYHDGSVYPSSMTDAAITQGDQKIVMSLAEARENIGMTAGGELPEGTYKVNFDSTTVGFKEEAHTYKDTGKDITITKSGTITGNWDKSIIRIKPKDASDTINIVLKDATFINGSSIVVDGKGIVNILFEGTIAFNADKAGIYTADIFDKIMKDGQNASITIKEKDKLNIIMYGKEGSTISCNNSAVFCGVAKCPYTTFRNPATQGLSAKWKYIMNTGQIWETNRANWIGSALFKDAETNDNFTLFYTNSADGGDAIQNDGVDGANWYGKYYDAY